MQQTKTSMSSSEPVELCTIESDAGNITARLLKESAAWREGGVNNGFIFVIALSNYRLAEKTEVSNGQ
jgi:hypothetical protein